MARARKGREPTAFYYDADGSRVELAEQPELLAMSQAALAALASSNSAYARALAAATVLGGGLVLLDLGELDDRQRRALRDQPSAQPVFEASGALLVVLPEIRIEESRGARPRAAVRSWLLKRAGALEIAEADERFTVQLTSGRGRDALDLTNALVEQVRPEMAQARFVRLVRKPRKS